MKTYYKVVTAKKKSLIINDERLITRSVKRCKKYNIQYKIDEWVEANNDSRLFVFETLAHATSFKQWFGGDIFECHVKGAINCPGLYFDKEHYPNNINLERMDDFWKMFNQFLKQKKGGRHIQERLAEYYDLSVDYFGNSEAILAKSVKLIKKIA